MAIKKVSMPEDVTVEEVNDKELARRRQEFIRGGGNVVADKVKKPKSNAWTKFCLRIKEDALERIDNAVSEKMGGNRTSWILEAIDEKLKRES